jgi:hypothetical protein
MRSSTRLRPTSSLDLYSVIEPGGVTSWAANYQVELDQDGDAGNALVSGHNVYGRPTGNSASATLPAGTYLIRSWIAGPDDNEVDAAASTQVTIPAPPRRLVSLGSISLARRSPANAAQQSRAQRLRR